MAMLARFRIVGGRGALQAAMRAEGPPGTAACGPPGARRGRGGRLGPPGIGRVRDAGDRNGSREPEGMDRTNRYTALLGPVCREPRIGYAGLSVIAPKVACGFEVRLTTGPLAREGGTRHDRARQSHGAAPSARRRAARD